MRLYPDRPADEIRQLILDQPTAPAEGLARLCGITIQQVAGYRAAHTLKVQRQQHAVNGRHASRQITARPPRQQATRRSAATRSPGPLPRALKAQLQTARTQAEDALKSYLTKALRIITASLVARTLKELDRYL